MATQKTFKIAGTTRLPSGTVKIRFANDLVSRIKILHKNGHTDMELLELGEELSKAQICQMLINHPKFQSEEQQDAISEFVVRNCKAIAKDFGPDANPGSEEPAVNDVVKQEAEAVTS